MNCNNTLTFLKEWERMCKHSDCDTCKVLELADLCDCDDAVCRYIAFTQKDKFIAIVQRWSDENTVSRANILFKLSSKIRTIGEGVNIPDVCPCSIETDYSSKCKNFPDCYSCKETYWNEVIE